MNGLGKLPRFPRLPSLLIHNLVCAAQENTRHCEHVPDIVLQQAAFLASPGVCEGKWDAAVLCCG